jgi:hypothetical protein
VTQEGNKWLRNSIIAKRKIRQTQIRGNATKYLLVLLTYQGYQKQGKCKNLLLSKGTCNILDEIVKEKKNIR